MPNENAVDEFLGQVNKEDVLKPDLNPFKDLNVEQKEVPAVEEKQEEKPLAYHEDPKLRKYIDKEIAKATRNMAPREEQKFREEVKEDGLISAFTAIIGNDTPEKINALNALKSEIETLRQDARSAKEELAAERTADLEAEQELAQGFEDIEETFGVDFQDKKLRSEFVEFIERVAPKDAQGEIVEYPDFNETFRLYQELNKKSNSRNKELASRSATRSSDASSVPMPQDTSWRGVEKFFNTLKGN